MAKRIRGRRPGHLMRSGPGWRAAVHSRASGPRPPSAETPQALVRVSDERGRSASRADAASRALAESGDWRELLRERIGALSWRRMSGDACGRLRPSLG